MNNSTKPAKNSFLSDTGSYLRLFVLVTLFVFAGSLASVTRAGIIAHFETEFENLPPFTVPLLSQPGTSFGSIYTDNEADIVGFTPPPSVAGVNPYRKWRGTLDTAGVLTLAPVALLAMEIAFEGELQGATLTSRQLVQRSAGYGDLIEFLDFGAGPVPPQPPLTINRILNSIDPVVINFDFRPGGVTQFRTFDGGGFASDFPFSLFASGDEISLVTLPDGSPTIGVSEPPVTFLLLCGTFLLLGSGLQLARPIR